MTVGEVVKWKAVRMLDARPSTLKPQPHKRARNDWYLSPQRPLEKLTYSKRPSSCMVPLQCSRLGWKSVGSERSPAGSRRRDQRRSRPTQPPSALIGPGTAEAHGGASHWIEARGGVGRSCTPAGGAAVGMPPTTERVLISGAIP